MSAVDFMGPAEPVRRDGDTRPGGGPIVVAVAVLLIVLGLLGAVPPAAAAATRDATPFAPALPALPAVGQAQLYAWDAGAFDLFGWSAAVSGDTALVGAPLHRVGGAAGVGAVYVFTRSGGLWTSSGRLVAADGAANDQFGTSVALEGETALVGAPSHKVGSVTSAGAVYVFSRAGGAWTQQAVLTAAGAADYDFFGKTVAVSGDTALVSATGRALEGRENAGVVYVFARSAGVWSQQAELALPAPATDDQFGISLDLDGDTALVGSYWRATGDLPKTGTARVFTRSGGVWTQQAELTAPAPAAGDQFGFEVALLDEVALVGAPFRDIGATEDAGAAYVFTHSGGVWTQQAELTAPAPAKSDELGLSVALSAERALVGAPLRDSGGNENAGAAYVFTRTGTDWTRQAELTAPDGAPGDWFGWPVALAGTTALIGAPDRATGGMRWAGAAYVFVTAPTVAAFSPASGPVGTLVNIAGSGFDDAAAVAFNGVPARFTVESDALITAFVPAGAESGAISVTAAGATGISAASFSVIPAPTITGLTPASGKRGALVTISGTDFGAVRGSGSVRFGGKICRTYPSWSDTRIVCRVPAKAAFGAVKVTVRTEGGTSNAKSFTVKR